MWFRTLLNTLNRQPSTSLVRRHREPARRRANARQLSMESLESRNVMAAMVSIDHAEILEGNSGVQNAAVVVSLSEPQRHSVTVDYRTVNGSARANADFSSVSGKLTFARGETSKTIFVAVRGDRVGEENEYFSVRLSSAKGARIANSEGYVTIVDNEPRIYVGGSSLVEGNTGSKSLEFTVSLSAAYDSPVTVNYGTHNGTATSGSDYNAVSGKLTFAAGETSKTILVPVRGDRLAESDEYFFLRISSASGAEIDNDEAYAEIADNEPRISIDDVSQLEGNSGTTPFTFTVNLAQPYDLPVTVNYSTADGEASAAVDYVAAGGVLQFSPGETSRTFSVAVHGDRLPELDKAFSVNLGTPHSFATMEKGAGYGTIRDDEPRLNITGATIYGGETSITFAVSLAAPTPYAGIITVDFTTVDGTAFAGVDYVATAGTVTFAPHETSKTITVELLNPVSVGQYFYVQLSKLSDEALITGELATGYWNFDYGYEYGYNDWWGYYDPAYSMY